jgi:hypothetical protein
MMLHHSASLISWPSSIISCKYGVKNFKKCSILRRGTVPFLKLKIRSTTNQLGPIGEVTFNLSQNGVQPNQQIKS